MAIELYHFGDSVCSLKVRICLTEKGLDWRGHFVDLLRFEHLKPDYLALNPNGVVPTLVHDGRVVVESSIINEYLDEICPEPPLRPSDPYERAQMRAWVKFEDDVLHPAVRPLTFNLMLKRVVSSMSEQELDDMVARHPKPSVARDWKRAASAPPNDTSLDSSRSKLKAALERLEAALRSGPWLAGGSYSLAEIAMAPILDRLLYLDLEALWTDLPAVKDWVSRIMERAAYRHAIPDSASRLPGPRSGADLNG